MPLHEIPYGGEINSQPLNENFQHLNQRADDVQQELNTLVDETVNWQRYKLTQDNGFGKPHTGNFDDLIDPGDYAISNVTGGPPQIPGNSYGVCIVRKRSAAAFLQIFVTIYSNFQARRLFIRSNENGVWQPWVEYLSDNVVMSGLGSPEGVIVAPVGTLYRRTNGVANTTLYVKELGTGNTGWVAK